MDGPHAPTSPSDFFQSVKGKLVAYHAIAAVAIGFATGGWRIVDSYLDEVQDSVTKPLAGYSYVGPRHTGQVSGTPTLAPTATATGTAAQVVPVPLAILPSLLSPSQCGPRTILQYEVINPGPGALENIKLVIAVDGTYDKVTEVFSNGLIPCDCGGAVINMAPGVTQHAPQIEITPQGGKRLDPGKRFLVSLDVPKDKWMPLSANVYSDGNQHSDANKPLPDLDEVLKSRTFYDTIRFWISIAAAVLTALIAAAVLYAYHRRVQQFLKEFAKVLPDWEKQIRADEAVKLQSTLNATRDLESGLPKGLLVASQPPLAPQPPP